MGFVKLTRIHLLLLALTAVSGCGQPPQDVPTVDLHPFSGIINVNGKPADGAMVSLHPLDNSALGVVTPNGITDESGLFFLTTYTNADGAPEGKYKVTVSWCDVVGGSSSDPDYGPEKLPRRYQDKDASGLEVEVIASSTETTVLDLKSR